MTVEAHPVGGYAKKNVIIVLCPRQQVFIVVATAITVQTVSNEDFFNQLSGRHLISQMHEMGENRGKI